MIAEKCADSIGRSSVATVHINRADVTQFAVRSKQISKWSLDDFAGNDADSNW